MLVLEDVISDLSCNPLQGGRSLEYFNPIHKIWPKVGGGHSFVSRHSLVNGLSSLDYGNYQYISISIVKSTKEVATMTLI